MFVFRRLAIPLLLSACLISFSRADAEEIRLGGAGGGGFGTIVEPTQAAPLRSAPPGMFSFPGEQLGTISKGTDYFVMGGKQIQNFFESDRWIQIAPIDPDGTVRVDKQGWVYWGNSATSPSPNFKAKLFEEVTPERYNNIIDSLKLNNPNIVTY